MLTATQKASLAAAIEFTDSSLAAVERLTGLNFDLARTACEKSSELTRYCLENAEARGGFFAWNPCLKSGSE